VNNIPPKRCTYSCTYCQVGATGRTEVERRTFHSPHEVVASVYRKLRACRECGEPVDYITFVPEGEPTLDAHLGEEIRALQALGPSVAVITNGSLLWRDDVCSDLAAAAVVSLKVDTVDERTWLKLNRSYSQLDLTQVMNGMLRFARSYRGRLLTETMLVAGMNDDQSQVRAVSDFLRDLEPTCAYLAIPTRPPAVQSVQPPSDDAVARAYACLAEQLANVEWLIGEEEGAFARTDDAIGDLLGILAVHPLREEEARTYLAEAGCEPDLLDRLVSGGRLATTRYLNRTFVTRPSSRRRTESVQ
jgi:wyosine [tRNA(Phe)-imidazoG37] synthetase (radical SAM superfamily)